MKLFIISLVLMTLMGCETLPKRDPVFTPVQPVDLRLPPQMNGSIYQAGYDMRLFEDLTAKRVGDILTVKLKESTQAKKKSDLDVEKDNSVSATAPILSGIDPSFIFDKDISAKIASGYKFEGEGEANQSNELSGDITVTVVAVYPNGNLKIRGEKRVTLNDGNEYIRLSGIIRPIDIDESNVILSTKVADATIMYTGDGTLADASKMGWFARFFYSPIFPF